MAIEPIKTESGKGRPAILNGGGGSRSAEGGIAALPNHPKRGAPPNLNGSSKPSSPPSVGGPQGPVAHKGSASGSPLR